MLPKKSGEEVAVIDTIYQGHGPVIAGNALAKVDEYIRLEWVRVRRVRVVVRLGLLFRLGLWLG